MQLISSVQTEFTLLARADNPLHTSPITKLPQVLHVRVYGNDFACTLVSGDTMSGIHHLHSERSPFIVQEGLVGRAETSPVDLDEDLALEVRTADQVLRSKFNDTWAWFLGDRNTLHGRSGFMSRTSLHSRILFRRETHGSRARLDGVVWNRQGRLMWSMER